MILPDLSKGVVRDTFRKRMILRLILEPLNSVALNLSMTTH